MPPFEAEPVDVSSGRFRDPQSVQRKKGDQGVLVRCAEAGGDQQPADLVPVQTSGVGLVVDARRRTCTAGEWARSPSSSA